MIEGSSDPPLVSVLMPSYNHARFITQAIESVWTQTHPNVELLIVDDGSSDDSVEIIRQLQARSPIPMKIETQANSGPGAALNRALAMARGEWICNLASDDYYSPEFIEQQLQEAARVGKDDIVIHCDAYLVELDGRITGTLDRFSKSAPLTGQAFDLLVSGGGRLHPCTMFLRRDLLLRVGAYDPDSIAEDWDLHLRLARTAEFHYVSVPNCYVRYTPSSLGKKPWLYGEGAIRALHKHEDRLGDGLPDILRRAHTYIAVRCFEYGEWGHGLSWAARAMGFAEGPTAKAATAGRMTAGAVRATARNIAYRLFGREKLVRAKRRLARPARES